MCSVVSSSSQALFDALRSPCMYRERPSQVRVIETHISWVFLTDHFVYKLKKPVQFDFLDFSTPEARHLACQRELQLNRQFSQDVYLDVQPITCDDQGKLALDGRGDPVDYVVKMRRLPAERSLDRLLQSGALHDPDRDALANHLAAVVVQLPAWQGDPLSYRHWIRNHCLANLAALEASCTAEDRVVLQRLRSAQLGYLTLAAPLFNERVRQHRIVYGHGDLRPEHVYLTVPPQIIDCIEFSDEFRLLDRLDELSFFAMECERLGHAEIGTATLAAYQAAAGDDFPERLLWFFKGYRASVRAKVAAHRASQTTNTSAFASGREIRQYLNRADHYARKLATPTLVVVSGLMGTGKSTLARYLADATGAELLQSDSFRQSLFGSSQSPANYAAGHYLPNLRLEVYRAIFAAAARALDQGRSVVLDAAFLTNPLRWEAMRLGKRHGGAPLLVDCECLRDVALARIAQRTADGQDASEARTDLYDAQVAEQEHIDSDLHAMSVQTTDAPEALLAQVLKRLRQQLQL